MRGPTIVHWAMRSAAPAASRGLGGLKILIILIILIMAVVVVITGCAAPPGGSVQARSLGDRPVVLHSRFVAAFYTHDPTAETSFFLSDVPLEALRAGEVTEGQVLHVELLWEPKPGATPMDSSATNASIRHIVIAGGEVGVYGGAGFASPRGKPGKPRLTISLRDASLTLLEASAGFTDLLSPARLTGRFTAVLDPRKSRELHYAVSQIVTNALGRSRFVGGGPAEVEPQRPRLAGRRIARPDGREAPVN